MADVDWYVFDESTERFSKLHDELRTIRDLIAPNGESDWFDDEGMWTDKGSAYLASYITDLQFYEGELERVKNELEKYSKYYAGNEEEYKKLGINSEQDLYDKREELIDQQYDLKKAQSDTQQSVVDMYESQIDAVEEYTNELVDSYNDYIDVVKEALDAERNLYDFKKNVQKQTKDIASLERRIASLSGSNNAADIAERRKLEAELYETREGLNDTYYDHAKDAQQKALEDETEAYENTMNEFVAGLRTSLQTATKDIGTFMEGVYNAVIQNAPAIEQIYGDLGVELNSAIINPWTEAANAIKKYQDGDGKNLGLSAMNSWIGEGGIFPTFSNGATTALTSPWSDGSKAIDEFKGSVSSAMSSVLGSIQTNVSNSMKELDKLKAEMSNINGTTVKPTIGGNNPNGDDTSYEKDKGDDEGDPSVRALQQILNQFFNAKLDVDGKYGPATTAAVKNMKNVLYKDAGYGTGNIPNKTATDGKYDLETKTMLQNYLNKRNVGSWFQAKKIGIPAAMYAKGTLGTTRDKLAITDESWIGEEITLAAGKNGQLQYLKKGSAVMPADISANLVEWGKINPDMMKIGGGTNLNMISNAVNKPEFNISFDSLVKAENITEETLPAVKKLVTQELNRFTKELNYAIKGYAR